MKRQKTGGIIILKLRRTFKLFEQLKSSYQNHYYRISENDQENTIKTNFILPSYL
jgi:hypothetical protein